MVGARDERRLPGLLPRPVSGAPTATSASHLFAPNVLREYDIRGTVGLTLDERDAYALGRVFGEELPAGLVFASAE